MPAVLLVGLGGAAGAMARYGLGLALPVRDGFPAATLLINFLGSFLIGILAGLAERSRLSKSLSLLLKTGLCGGFTTFSTFSLEAADLFRSGRWPQGSVYAVLSLGLCLAGVVLGRMAIRVLIRA